MTAKGGGGAISRGLLSFCRIGNPLSCYRNYGVGWWVYKWVARRSEARVAPEFLVYQCVVNVLLANVNVSW